MSGVVEYQEAMWVIMLENMIQNSFVDVELRLFVVVDGMYRALIAESVSENAFQSRNLCLEVSKQFVVLALINSGGTNFLSVALEIVNVLIPANDLHCNFKITIWYFQSLIGGLLEYGLPQSVSAFFQFSCGCVIRYIGGVLTRDLHRRRTVAGQLFASLSCHVGQHLLCRHGGFPCNSQNSRAAIEGSVLFL